MRDYEIQLITITITWYRYFKYPYFMVLLVVEITL